MQARIPRQTGTVPDSLATVGSRAEISTGRGVASRCEAVGDASVGIESVGDETPVRLPLSPPLSMITGGDIINAESSEGWRYGDPSGMMVEGDRSAGGGGPWVACTMESGGAESTICSWGAIERVGGARDTTSSGARGFLGRRLVEMMLELSGTSLGAMVGQRCKTSFWRTSIRRRERERWGDQVGETC